MTQILDRSTQREAAGAELPPAYAGVGDGYAARTGQLQGLSIGVLIRVSTDDQIDNYSAQAQEGMLARFIVQDGGAILPYDENEQKRGVSGRRLAKRRVACRLLDDIKAKRVHGIGVADIKRLTRDEFGADAGVIAQVLVASRAYLVTPGRVYRLWNKDDLTAYRFDALIAGRDVLDIRDTFWRGVFGRAEQEPFFMGKPPFGYTTEIIEVPDPRGRGRVKIKRVPKKDPTAARAMADLTEWLDACVSLGEVTRRMNAANYLPPILRGRDAGARTIWTTWRIRWMFDRPVYQGIWHFGHGVDRNNPVWDTDQRRERVRPVPAPELAYWTRGQVLAWKQKFAALSGRAKVRARTYPRPLLGVLACAGCGRPLIAAGKLGYQCPTKARSREVCPYAQTLSEPLAARKLREILPVALQEAAWFEDEVRRQAAESSELDATRAQAAVIRARLELSAGQWYGRKMPKSILDEMERDGIALEKLEQQIVDEEARSLAGADADEAVRLLLDDPEATFDALPWEKQAWAYRLLLSEVQFAASGRGGGRRLEVTHYRNRITGSTGDLFDRSGQGTGFGTETACSTLAKISTALVGAGGGAGWGYTGGRDG